MSPTSLPAGFHPPFSGGTASSTTIYGGGTEFVSSGGTTISTMVSSGGFEIVSAGGTASGTTISASGEEIIKSGGTAVSAIVSNGGIELVSSGGLASGAVVSRPKVRPLRTEARSGMGRSAAAADASLPRSTAPSPRRNRHTPPRRNTSLSGLSLA